MIDVDIYFASSSIFVLPGKLRKLWQKDERKQTGERKEQGVMESYLFSACEEVYIRTARVVW